MIGKGSKKAGLGNTNPAFFIIACAHDLIRELLYYHNMADVFDRTQEPEQQLLQNCLRAYQGKGDILEASATGSCLYCFERIKKGAVNKRFCAVDCRDDYERQEAKGKLKK